MTDDARPLATALGPRYALRDEIGRGGMALVYRARDLKHDRDVAVKVLNPEVANQIAVGRFEREIAIAATLQHPGIVPLYDSGAVGEVIYFIMPLVEGETLRERLEREPQLGLGVAVDIVRDVAAALDYAHGRGVIHRDVKPENILLTSGKAMVADFGIARAIATSALQPLTETGVVLGTPLYMSPEQVSGSQDLDGRTDEYALGCVFFEMLSGEPPFTGRTAQAVAARHLNERPPSLRVVRPSVTVALEKAVERALAKAPADRFDTATAFAEAAARATREPVEQVAPGRSWRRWGVAAVVAAMLAGTGVWATAREPTALSADKVVVYPLSVVGSDADSATGEQVALMIGSALEHTEPLRWLDGLGLPGVRDRAFDARREQRTAASAARDAGARYYLDGAVVTTPDSLTVIVRLHDTVDDSLYQESASGPRSATAPSLALRAIGQVLPRLLPPNGRIDLTYLSDRKTAAIADWLQGEREYAHSRYASARALMDRALATDSAIGVAALKGAQAAAHLEDYASARTLIDIALALDRQLPARHHALARGLQHYIGGRADSALASFTAARDADTTWSEPWMWMGETYYHLIPVGIALDSAAERAYATAVRQNPTFAPALFHLAEFAIRRGDAPTARRLVREFTAVSPDSNWTFQLDLTLRCALGGDGEIDWPAAVQRASDRVVNLGRVVGAGGQHEACSRRALQAVLDHDTSTSTDHRTYRWSALKLLNFRAVAEGRGDRAYRLADSASANGEPAGVSLHMFDAVAGLASSDSAAAATMQSLLRPFASMGRERSRYFVLWTFHQRDEARLDSVVRRLTVLADSTRSPVDRAVRDGAVARLALLRLDTAGALGVLRQLRPVGEAGGLTWDLWESIASERILLAEVLAARREWREALDIASAFDTPVSQMHTLYLARSLMVREKAATGLSRPALARAFRARLEALRARSARPAASR